MLAINMCEYVTAYGFYLPYEDSSYHDVEPSWLHSNTFDFTRGFSSTMDDGNQDTSDGARHVGSVLQLKVPTASYAVDGRPDIS